MKKRSSARTLNGKSPDLRWTHTDPLGRWGGVQWTTGAQRDDSPLVRVGPVTLGTDVG